jgi:putative Mn2+ efflux pump MntP
MSKWLALIGATVGGALGWWVGSALGFFGAFVLCLLGTAAGTHAGRRLARHYLV